MAQRFFNQSSRVKYVKPYVNRRTLPQTTEIIEEKQKDMKNIENLDKLDELLQNIDGEVIPKKKVKIERKDRGIIERTENSKIILTEDNQMLLND